MPKKKKSLKGWPLSKEEHALAQLGGGKQKYSDYLKNERKRKNMTDKRGRIFEGPRGGQWTSGKGRKGPPNQQIENCNWLKKKKKK